jgi:hypothetical protein
VSAGGIVCLAAARGDLWLDEIWSLANARALRSPFEALTRIHLDNNHHLVTAWLWVIGDGSPPWAYRLVSVMSAAATVALAALRPLHRDRLEGLTAGILLAGSFLLVQYGSEARGYAPAALCAVAAFHAVDRWLASRRTPWAAAAGLLATVGLLAHLTYAFALAGLACWAALALRATWRERPASPAALAWLAMPFAALAALWAVDLRHLVIGGGPEYDLVEVLRETLRATLGIPRGPLELLAIVALGAAAYEVIALARAGDRRWAFFAVTVAAAPALLLAARRPPILAPRYFLVTVPFLLVLLASALARLARLGAAGRVFHAAALALFCVGNAVPIAALLRHGRGHYGDAVAYLVEHTPGDAMTIGSDHDFRNGMVLGYYAERLRSKKEILYVEPGGGVPPPEWYLHHDFADPPRSDPSIEVFGRRYVLAASFPYAGLSGWRWLLYRRHD